MAIESLGSTIRSTAAAPAQTLRAPERATADRNEQNATAQSQAETAETSTAVAAPAADSSPDSSTPRGSLVNLVV